MEAKINLSDEQYATIAAKVMAELLPAQVRDQLIAEALQRAITPDRSSYGSGGSAIQNAFDNAVQSLLNQIVKEKIDSDPAIRQKVEGLIGAALTRFLDFDYDCSRAVAEGMVNALRKQG
jgi:hypothetical protein